MIVINPPWTLWKAMTTALPALVQLLAPTDEGYFRQEQLVDE
jgi:23S rRNA A2030 N6-methylase RlmJ